MASKTRSSDRLDTSQLAAEATHPAPSTYDLFQPMPGISGGQDIVLIVLESAALRYREGATPNTYVGNDAYAVCAAGALVASDEEGFGKVAEDQEKDISDVFMRSDLSVMRAWEEYASDAVKEALQLVNETAVELYAERYPQLEGWTGGPQPGKGVTIHPFGPIELLNQELSWDDDEIKAVMNPEGRVELWPQAKAAVLDCYYRTIEKRKSLAVA